MPCGYCSQTAQKVLFMMIKIAGEVALVGFIASVFIVAAQAWREEMAAEEASGREYLRTLDEKMNKLRNREWLATWAYETNITAYNEQQLHQTSLECAEEKKELWKETMTYLWHEFEDEELKRMFKKYSILGTAALPEDLNQRLLQAISNMQSTYAMAHICDYHDRTKCDLYVEPGVTDIFATSEDPEELKYAWLEWHKAAGAPSKGNFTEYVQMNNEAAKLNGFDSVAEWWLSEYETADIEDQFTDLWAQIKPLYQQIHAYVRGKLRQKYGDSVVSAKGPIPAHLLGNIWAQTWNNIEKIARPYPEKADIDVTAALIEQNYTAVKLLQTANEFFTSLNLEGVSDMFWERSIIERVDGVDMVCHASAWDFFDGEDFRIRQCTSITTNFFKTTHHEMGHIQYYMLYKDQPGVFRGGANPGFHEAVGDVIALSAETPKHYRVMGLLEGDDDVETNINHLFTAGLQKIAFLPFGYLLDLYRYSVFRGTTTPDEYNCHFWQLRESFQGVEPPAPRTEADFDPAAKYHIAADVEYMRYYISYIIQFQFHQSLCQIAGEYVPGDVNKSLSNCDIYRSTEAGDALRKMLEIGSSKPWPDAMEMLTGQRNMDAGGLLEYFEPLYEWLRAENEKNGEYIGWESSTVEYCTSQQRMEMKDSDFLKNIKKLNKE